jgi:hypothetical protein
MIQKRTLPVAEAIIVTLAVAALVIGAYASGRREESSVSQFDTRSSYDAASGGYRAWYELLDREGVRIERFERRPAFLDQSVDVYITASNLLGNAAQAKTGKDFEIMLPGDWDALAKWVKAGGHLVWLADGISRPEYLNVPPINRDGPSVDVALPLVPSALTDGVGSVSGTARLRVHFRDSAQAAPVIGDDTGGVIVSYPLGKGNVTVATDESVFENARLTKADNARLAFNLATTGLGQHGSVAFDEWSHGFAAGDTWWQVLPRHFQISLVAIAVALLLLAVGTTFRFGPTARLPDETERTSAEYLSSMALLYERGRAVKKAVGDLADACIRDVAARLGLAETAPARTIAARLQGGGAGDDRGEAVMELDRLRSYEYPHAADLIRAATLCASLRKDFTRHGRIGIGRRRSAARRTA